MERLTKRTGSGGITYEANDDYIITCYPDNDNLRAVDKMAVRLCELEDKLESGQLVELPCKVGDTVWYVNTQPSISLSRDTVYEGKVVRFHIANFPQPIRTTICADIQIHNECGTSEMSCINELGKTWFLDKEQAEARLKELQENQ